MASPPGSRMTPALRRSSIEEESDKFCDLSMQGRAEVWERESYRPLYRVLVIPSVFGLFSVESENNFNLSSSCRTLADVLLLFQRLSTSCPDSRRSLWQFCSSANTYVRFEIVGVWRLRQCGSLNPDHYLPIQAGGLGRGSTCRSGPTGSG